MLKIGEDEEYTWYCTFEGRWKCLYDENGNFDGQPALKDCIVCGSLLFKCKKCGRFVTPEAGLPEEHSAEHSTKS